MRGLLTLFLVLGSALPLAAQHAAQPYAGEQHRPVKALSEAQIEGYLRGDGMGYAKAAELNQYPGPRHVLDLAEPLALSAEQRARTEALFHEMQAQARRLGAQVVAKETELDRLFAECQASEARVGALLREIGQVQAELRGVHLNAHLAMRELLTPAQIARYDELRGYTGAGAPAGHPPHR